MSNLTEQIAQVRAYISRSVIPDAGEYSVTIREALAALDLIEQHAARMEKALRWERDTHPITHPKATDYLTRDCDCPVCAALDEEETA